MSYADLNNATKDSKKMRAFAAICKQRKQAKQSAAPVLPQAKRASKTPKAKTRKAKIPKAKIPKVPKAKAKTSKAKIPTIPKAKTPTHRPMTKAEYIEDIRRTFAEAGETGGVLAEYLEIVDHTYDVYVAGWFDKHPKRRRR